ncbi:MAG: cytochrome c biogenesis protein CcdA [Chloroflexota bacterium]
MRHYRFIILLSVLILAFGSAEARKTPVKLKAQPSALEVKSGGKFYVRLNLTFDKYWHAYGIKEVVGPDGIGPTPTAFSVKPASIAVLGGKIIAPKGKVKFDEGFQVKVESYEGSANFDLPLIAKKDIDFRKDKLTIVASMQLCDTTSCLPPDDYTAVTLPNVFAGAEKYSADTAGTAAVDASLATAAEVEKVSPAEKNENLQSAKTESQSEIEQKKSEGIFSFLWFAMTAGALALLTPCVFPMVPITVSFFTKRAEKEKASGLKDSLVYAFGIISTFTALGIALALIFGATGIRDFASNGWVNIAIAAVFVIFALNLFGAFEIQLPTGLLNKLNSKSRGSGMLSVFLMALTFSLTSFTCTVPFVGSALISASGGEWFYPIIGMLGFSAVFAAPFFLLALFPSAMKSLPKAGGWMNNVKVVMGFLEIAAAIKFMSNADLVWSWGVLSKEFFLSIWIGIAILVTIYILGFFKLSHDSPVEKIGSLRVVFAIAFSAITFYLLSGLFGKPLGELDAFLPPAEYHEIMGQATVAPTISPTNSESKDKAAGTWHSDIATGMAEAKQTGKLLFVDFTGFTCTNCRWMEQNMFKKASITALMDKFVKVKLYTDRNMEPYISNKKLQESKYGSIELPLYVIMTADGKTIGTKTFTRDENEFMDFLNKGME